MHIDGQSPTRTEPKWDFSQKFPKRVGLLNRIDKNLSFYGENLYFIFHFTSLLYGMSILLLNIHRNNRFKFSYS